MPVASRARSPSLMEDFEGLCASTMPSWRESLSIHTEQIGGHFERLLAHPLCSNVNRGARVHGLAAGKSAVSHRYIRGIAGDDVDFVWGHAELFGGDLGKHGFGALSHCGRAGIDRNAPRPSDSDNAGFERSAAGALHAIGDADAEISPR